MEITSQRRQFFQELVPLNQESEERIPEEPLSVDLINPLPVDVLDSVEGAHSTSKRDSAGNLLASGDKEDIKRRGGF